MIIQCCHTRCDSSSGGMFRGKVVQCKLQQSEVLRLMKFKGKSMTNMQKVTILSFDEVYLSDEICFDKQEQRIIGPCKSAQVVMARGLFSDWKQPIYFKFDQAMTKAILFEIIRKVEPYYTVVAIVCDMGASNQGLWKSFDID
uniref:Transposable element P transposase-like RNase H domain-containing protein n=1 Tax=Photinus pyralis TaxID=7054 RepID=A0A1Y1MIA0_PHOPY